jgi:hypothetical protein
METLTSYEFPAPKHRSGSKYDIILNDAIYRIRRGDVLFPDTDPAISAEKIEDRFHAVAMKRQRKLKCAIEDADTVVVQFVVRTK